MDRQEAHNIIDIIYDNFEKEMEQIHKEWKEYTRNELVNLSEACYEKYNG